MTDNKEKEADDKEKKTDEKTDDSDEKKADGADETKTKGRYVVALRKWDSNSAAYKDESIAEDSLKKKQLKNVAYIFRRVIFETYYGKTRSYTELEIEDPALVQLLRSEIDNKYPGVNFEGNTIYMQAPFPAIVRTISPLR